MFGSHIMCIGIIVYCSSDQYSYGYGYGLYKCIIACLLNMSAIFIKFTQQITFFELFVILELYGSVYHDVHYYNSDNNTNIINSDNTKLSQPAHS